MSGFKSTMLQLVFLGALFVSPAYLQQPPCDIVKKTVTRGAYKLNVEPSYFKPSAIYTVTITGIDNSTSVILQALPSEYGSSGLWESENKPISCSGVENLVETNVSSDNSARTRWTAPNANVESVLIKSFVTFANGTTLLQTQTLERDTTTTSTRSVSSSATPRPDTSTTGTQKPTLHSNSPDAHILLNATTIHHHNLASSHQWTQGPKGSASAAQGSSFLLAFLQLLSISLGFKLLS
ncbi:uncharacterized protein LOC118097175 [Zootoca vivipara]|uniref:uncharacterized protein LOC118097175 n=1 Tax=Zootoca vivipara TaxID=8524 RepID=UPI001590C2D9|nr:uncharacterized protein LOC118097175 [Zootoca vivipara]